MSQPKPSSTKKPTPRTSKEDILMSIKPEHMRNIAAGTKNHEYRRYLLPSSVRRIWLYTTAPASRIEYVARISRGKTPGQVVEDGGLGNEDFNAGRKVSKFAYEILELWRLREPISLKEAVEKGFLKGAPQKYCWAPVALLEGYPLARQDLLLSREGSGPRLKAGDGDGGHDAGEEKGSGEVSTAAAVGGSKISDFFAPLAPNT
ncbi:hypothetical protein BJY01DRAFT_257158 [Aspergillus pseudoustus]|uniref:Uncharacterized protein n=1 Tax=Aspergillus pseudoustus TaxID=1810923 RepID=A0ABR4JMB7_9EURO